MNRRVAIAAVALAVVGALWASGSFTGLTDAEQIRERVLEADPFGPLVFILVSMLSFTVFLLGPPVWASTAIWPLPLAILYSFVACLAASLLTYGLARLLGQGWAQKHVPDKLRRYEDRLEARPALTVLLLRILLWANPLVDLLVGVSRASFGAYLLGTVIGLVPTTAFQVILGKKGIELAAEAPTWLWGLLLAGALVALLVRWSRRNRRNATAEAGSGERSADRQGP
jgi:uncharacterized membrane protein YdjX (TVP38/TMEM64 family)